MPRWTFNGISPVPDPEPPVGAPYRENGGADHDKPYAWGRKPRVSTPYPFTFLEFGHLLILRGKLRDTPDVEDTST